MTGLKGYNRRTAIDPFEEKEAKKDNSFRDLVVFIAIAALITFLIL
ncbi:MAG: hypothetical protein NT001_02650 [Candidatus Woesearchaeota archaeon]|nr:hypothetical protein [Candidatus Woesearchaeota archaeon]